MSFTHVLKGRTLRIEMSEGRKSTQGGEFTMGPLHVEWAARVKEMHDEWEASLRAPWFVVYIRKENGETTTGTVAEYPNRAEAEGRRDLLVEHDTGNTLSVLMDYGITQDPDSDSEKWIY